MLSTALNKKVTHSFVKSARQHLLPGLCSVLDEFIQVLLKGLLSWGRKRIHTKNPTKNILSVQS